MSTPTESERKRGNTASILGAWLTLALLGSSVATAQGPLLEASTSLGGFYREGGPLALRLEIDSPGGQREVMASVELPAGTTSARFAFPSPSRQTLEMPLSIHDRRHSLEVVLSSDGRQLARHKVALRPLAAADRLVIVASDDARAASGHQSEPGEHVLLVAPTELPRAWYGYEPVDLLVLEPGAAARLDAIQHRALRAWLSAGGRLTSSLPDSDAERPTPEAAVRATIDSTASDSLWRIDRRILADLRGSLDPDRRAPLWLSAVLTLYCLSFAVVMARPGRSPQRHWRRIALSAGLIALFTVLAASVGRVALAGEGRLRASSIAHFFPGSRTSLTTARVSLTSKARGLERLIADAPGVALDVDSAARYELHYGEGSSPTLVVPSRLFSRTHLWVRSVASGEQPLTRTPRGLTNRTRFALGPCVLAEGNVVADLSDLPAGGSIELTLRPKPAAPGVVDSPDRGRPLLDAVLERYREEGLLDESSTAVLCHAERFLATTRLASGARAPAGPATIVIHLQE